MNKKMITIGIDCGSLSGMQIVTTGTQRIAYELLKRIGALDRTIQYVLYSYRPIRQQFLDEFGNQFKNRVIFPSLGYAKLRLPIELALHTPQAFIGLSQFLPRMNIRSIIFVHDLGFLHRNSMKRDRILKHQTTYACSHAHHIIVNSKSTKDDIQKEYMISDSHITIMPLGVDKIFSPIGFEYYHPYPYVLHVGGMRKDKNISILLRSIKRIQDKERTRLDLLLAGDTRDFNNTIHKISKYLGISESVKLIHHPDDALLSTLYRGALATVIPSFWEGFGIPAIESLASGCPVIASNRGAMTDCVEKTLLLDPDDENGWTNAMMHIIHSTSIRHIYKKNSDTIAKTFSWSNSAKIIYHVIKQEVSKL